MLFYLPLITSLMLAMNQRLSHESILTKYHNYSLSEGVVFVRLFAKRGVPQTPHARIINTEFNSKEDLGIAIIE